jgi:hypothetical protein
VAETRDREQVRIAQLRNVRRAKHFPKGLTEPHKQRDHVAFRANRQHVEWRTGARIDLIYGVAGVAECDRSATDCFDAASRMCFPVGAFFAVAAAPLIKR